VTLLLLLATAALAVLLLLGPFTIVANLLPLQRLVLRAVGTTGGSNPRFTTPEAMRRVGDLLRYLALRRPLPNDGFYSSVELTHMVDVQHIFQLVYAVTAAALLLSLVLLPVLHRHRQDLRRPGRAAARVVLGLIVVLGALLATVGFDRIFIVFHELAFANDFWLLPETSSLIRLFPEQYFMTYFLLALCGSVLAAVCLLLPWHRHSVRF
jgi:integral membrane protein (TIGR01906 family)